MKDTKNKKNYRTSDSLLADIEKKNRRDDCSELAELMQSILNTEPQLWSNNIISFGGYKSNNGKGIYDYFWAGFTSVKRSLVIYLAADFEEKENKNLLKNIGKCKIGVSSIYINKLTDIDKSILKTLIERSKITA